MDLHKVSHQELEYLAQVKGAVRVGSTVDPVRRARDYAREDGYRGQMYVAETPSMMRTEDRLLNIYPHRHNSQRLSNNQDQPGYGYVIKGRKMK